MYKKTVDLFFLNIYSSYFRSAIIQSESEATKEGRRAWYSRGAQGEGSRGGRRREGVRRQGTSTGRRRTDSQTAKTTCRLMSKEDRQSSQKKLSMLTVRKAVE